ncbi:MAG: hypothetical protein ACRBFS_06900 [Aureispira sp.]
MKVIKFYTFFILSILLTLYACSLNQPTILDSPEIESGAFEETRTIKKKVAAKAYYYRTLASFVNGSLTSTIIDAYQEGNDQVNLVVLYEATASWAEGLHADAPQTTGNEYLNTLLVEHQLQIVKQFAIDNNNKGLVLEASTQLQDPVETARRLSLIEHVLMVNIKEVPTGNQLSLKQKNK